MYIGHPCMRTFIYAYMGTLTVRLSGKHDTHTPLTHLRHIRAPAAVKFERLVSWPAHPKPNPFCAYVFARYLLGFVLCFGLCVHCLSRGAVLWTMVPASPGVCAACWGLTLTLRSLVTRAYTGVWAHTRITTRIGDRASPYLQLCHVLYRCESLIQL